MELNLSCVIVFFNLDIDRFIDNSMQQSFLFILLIIILLLNFNNGYKPLINNIVRNIKQINNIKTLSYQLNAQGKGYGPSQRVVKNGGKYNVETLKNKLSSAGKSGLIAYGLLNFLYYTTASCASWKLLATDIPLKETITLSKKIQITTVNIMKLSGIVWAGSQITKAFRLIGAIALAPTADKLLNSFQKKFRIVSKDKAFWIMSSLILLTFFTFYGSLILFTALFGYK